MIMNAGPKTRVKARALTAASSGAMLMTVSGNKNAIGYEGIGYITKSVRGVAVDGAFAAAAGVRSGKYPLSRYLYMFTGGWPSGNLLAFINYMQGAAGQKIVAEKGFVPLWEIK